MTSSRRYHDGVLRRFTTDLRRPVCRSPGLKTIRFVGIGKVGASQVAGTSFGILTGVRHLLLDVSNQIKFNKQQRAEGHLQVAKTLIKMINIYYL